MKTYMPALSSAFLSLAFSTAHAATTWHVEANGLDKPSCGSATVACRSISYTINLAAPGDTVLVGPGRYGDLNHDGDLTDPGEEGQTAGYSYIFINKALRVVSSHGAGATIIDCTTTGLLPYSIAVRMNSANITFGGPDAGFTIVGHYDGSELYQTHTGIYVDLFGGNIRVEGNVIIGLYTGFQVAGFGSGGSAVLASNYATGVGWGYEIQTSAPISHVTLTNNVANGFLGLRPGSDGFGFSFETPWEGENTTQTGTTITATGNVSSGNRVGYLITTPAPLVFKNNTASGNFGAGMVAREYSDGADPRKPIYTLAGFSALGNMGPGIDIRERVRMNVTGSNFSGNDEVPGTNCGIRNFGGGAVNAKNNYWGAAKGPGANPADLGGKPCDGAPAVTTVKPFATTRFAVTR